MLVKQRVWQRKPKPSRAAFDLKTLKGAAFKGCPFFYSGAILKFNH